jgi:hypothetical protein
MHIDTIPLPTFHTGYNLHNHDGTTIVTNLPLPNQMNSIDFDMPLLQTFLKLHREEESGPPQPRATHFGARRSGLTWRYTSYLISGHSPSFPLYRWS